LAVPSTEREILAGRGGGEGERLAKRGALRQRQVGHVVEAERLALKDPAQHLLHAKGGLPPALEVGAEHGFRLFGEEADQVGRGRAASGVMAVFEQKC
jgi:hypothetical protein